MVPAIRATVGQNVRSSKNLFDYFCKYQHIFSHSQAAAWFMQDGCGPHNSAIVKNYLESEFPQRWMGTYGPMR